MRKNFKIVAFFIVLGFLVRRSFVLHMPVSYDEGSYLYDGLNIIYGLVPYQDFLTKSIPFIYSLSIITKFFGNSLFIARYFMVFISFISSIFIYLITKKFFNQKIAIWASLLFWVFPSIAAYTSVIYTEVLQICLILVSLYLLVLSFQNKKLLYTFLSSIFVSLAFFTRQTSIFFIFASSLLILFSNKSSKKKAFKLLLTYLLGIGIFMLVSVSFSVSTIGFSRTIELLGLGAIDLSIVNKAGMSFYGNKFIIQKILEVISEASMLSRDAMFMMFITVLSLTSVLNIVINKFTKFSLKHINTLTIILLALLVTIFQSKYAINAPYWYIWFWERISLILLVGTFSYIQIFYSSKLIDKYFGDYQCSKYLMWLWIIGLSGTYALWIKFRSAYLIEFFPPIVILSALTLERLSALVSQQKSIMFSNRFVIKTMFVLLLITSFFYSYEWNYKMPSMGVYNYDSIERVVTFLKENSEENDEILTASLIFPYLSGNRVPFSISHPSWYGYNYINEADLLLYFPPFNEFENYVKNNKTKYIVSDNYTSASYFKRYPNFSKYVDDNYTIVLTQGQIEIFEYRGQSEREEKF